MTDPIGPTPRPWMADLYYIVAEVPGGRSGGEVIGEMRDRAIQRIPLPRVANADLIVRAVNERDAYERLEAACIEMREANRGKGRFVQEAWVAYDKIIDALDDLRRSQKEETK